MPENKDVCLGLMTWREIETRLKESDIALIPVGQIEQHGLHASIDLDSRNAEGIAIRAALAAFKSSKPVVAPAICYGYSDLPGLRDYPGVFSLRGETLVNLCYDVAFSLIRMGFSKIIFVNGHDANPPFIKEALRRLTKKTGAFCAMSHISEMNNSAAEAILKKHEMPLDFGHACLNCNGVRHGSERRFHGGTLLRQNRRANREDIPSDSCRNILSCMGVP